MGNAAKSRYRHECIPYVGIREEWRIIWVQKMVPVYDYSVFWHAIIITTNIWRGRRWLWGWDLRSSPKEESSQQWVCEVSAEFPNPSSPHKITHSKVYHSLSFFPKWEDIQHTKWKTTKMSYIKLFFPSTTSHIYSKTVQEISFYHHQDGQWIFLLSLLNWNLK